MYYWFDEISPINWSILFAEICHHIRRFFPHAFVKSHFRLPCKRNSVILFYLPSEKDIRNSLNRTSLPFFQYTLYPVLLKFTNEPIFKLSQFKKSVIHYLKEANCISKLKKLSLRGLRLEKVFNTPGSL